MPRPTTSTRAWVWLFVVLSIGAALLLTGLGDAQFRPYDEGLYGKLARYALDQGVYLHAVDDAGQFDPKFSKPPLTIWLVAVSFKIFGASLWSLRLPFALGTLTLAAVCFGWGYRLRGLLMAVVWSGGLLASEAVLRWGRHACIEPMFVAFLLGSLWAYHVAVAEKGRRARGAAIVCGLLLSLAFLTKQLAFGVGVLPILVLEVLRREPRASLHRVLPALGLPVATALLWFAVTYRSVGADVFRIVGVGVVERMQGFDNGHNGRGLGELALVIAEGMAPWSWPLAFVAAGLMAAAIVRQRSLRDPALLLIGFLLACVLVYGNVSASMLPWYAANFVPPLCGGVAWCVAAVRASNPEANEERAWLIAERGVGLANVAVASIVAATSLLSPLNVAAFGVALLVLAATRPRPTLRFGLGLAALLGLASQARSVEFRQAPGGFTNFMPVFAERGIETVAVAKSTGLVSQQYVTFFGPDAEVTSAPWHPASKLPNAQAWVTKADLPIEYEPPAQTELLRTPGGVAVIGPLKNAPWSTDWVSDRLDDGPVNFEAEHLHSGESATIEADADASGGFVRRASQYRGEEPERFSFLAGPTVQLRKGRYRLSLFGEWSCAGLDAPAGRLTVSRSKQTLHKSNLDCDDDQPPPGEPGTFDFSVREDGEIRVGLQYRLGVLVVDKIGLERLR